MEACAVSVLKFLVESGAEFITYVLPPRPIVGHVILSGLLLDHSLNLGEEIFLVVNVVNLIHLRKSLFDQLILE